MKEVKQIIRICNTDLNGDIPVIHSLTKIKGIGFSFANAICNHLDLDKNQKVGSLSDEERKQIEATINDPKDFPNWLLNRRKDFQQGIDKHLVSSNLTLQNEFDVKRMSKIKSYKGIRHASNLPVRGQRTRSNFRHGAAIGVQKKKAKMGKK